MILRTRVPTCLPSIRVLKSPLLSDYLEFLERQPRFNQLRLRRALQANDRTLDDGLPSDTTFVSGNDFNKF